MIIDYVQLSPTGNITILVKTPLPRARQAAVAARLLAADAVGGEQAGFLEAPADPRARARLQMMGGEFCGNAAMSLGVLLARDAGLMAGETAELLLEVSGGAGPVPCRVRRDGDAWVGAVRMPLPKCVGETTLETDAGPLTVPLVEMPGISHLILPADAGLSEAQLRRRLPEWNRRLGADALGALAWDAAASSIDPLVYVPCAGTLVREHGCGSGSAAIGCWLASQRRSDICADIRQPGGVIRAEARHDGSAVAALTITGRVEILREGSIRMD